MRDWLRRPTGRGFLAVGGAIAFAFMVAIGAGAAPSPVTPFSEVLGLGGERGAAVSQAAHDAKAEAVESGENVGAAVSTAVCMVIQDPANLPPGAQNAPGHEKDPKDCTHPSDEEDSEDEAVEDEASEEDTEAEILSEHDRGALVSQAAHDAKADAKESGENVGAAVSTAVCMVIQDPSNLPQGAQNAPGHQKDPKDCTHPSDADQEDGESEAEGTSQGHGKQSAPGQLKKQND